MVSHHKLRHSVQFIWAFVTNAYLKGFTGGKIYTGSLKKLCVPGLNCYSCPGALGSCPIGAMQSVIGSIRYSFSMYVMGFVLLIGVVFGRFICGWLCPFGLLQDLLYKIPIFKISVSKRVNSILKYLKYAILIIFVLLLPFIFQDELGISDPYFCKYICPAGTLEGGVPLVIFNETLREGLGFLFGWKLAILIIFLIVSVLIFRPFCRYVCPLGALYSLFNPISFYKLKVNLSKCTHCNICTRSCKINIEVHKTPNNPECIRCQDCIEACPQKAISKELIKIQSKNRTEEHLA
ncbi:4Fe-4S binding protein [Vallitalea pronyensis]|uniref:4Fe-4S binding protein n=2 Tax=Vallitalea pronyensis TaxID=1348613 RepID=A0A8J8SI02_9FIRM|nr:4Fe-4S binding protein [Vallitalea pronyensis]QUI23968.1 4Fe-4S binding protein [Vallitalea pronyensis]